MKCSECGGIVSDKAKCCPHCGAPVSISISNLQLEKDSDCGGAEIGVETKAVLGDKIKSGITSVLREMGLPIDQIDDPDWEFVRSRFRVHGGENEERLPWYDFRFSDEKRRSLERKLSAKLSVPDVRVGGNLIFVPTHDIVRPSFIDTFRKYELDRRLKSVADGSTQATLSYWQCVSKSEQGSFMSLPVPVGIYFDSDVNAGMVSLVDLTDQNVLVGGRSGSGKSSLLHQMICSLAMSRTRSQVELIMFDLADKEFEPYEELPLCGKVVYDPESALSVLRECAEELRSRYFDDMNPRSGTHGSGWGSYNLKRMASGMGSSPFKVLVIDDLDQLCAAVGIEGIKILQEISTGWKSGYYVLAATSKISRGMKFDYFNFQHCYSFSTDDTKQSRLLIGSSAASRIEVPGDFASSYSEGRSGYHCFYIDKQRIREIVDLLLDNDCRTSRINELKLLNLYSDCDVQ